MDAKVSSNIFIKTAKDLLLAIPGIMLFYYIFGCPFRTFLGISCPGCGMSRAFFSILRLDFKGAFHYHPMIYAMPLCLLVLVLKERINKTLSRVFWGIIIALFLGIWLYRIRGGYETILIFSPQKGLIFRGLRRLTLYGKAF